MKHIPLFKVFMSPFAGQEVTKTLYSGFIGEGPKVKEFERELNKYMRTSDDIITVNSATSGEHLLYKYLKKDRTFQIHEGQGVVGDLWRGLRKDDEVLTTALTCTATNWPIINEGLNLRWVDVDPITLNMSLDSLEATIDHKTRIVTVVHWGGNPIDLDRLSRIVKNAEGKYGRRILVIEDCAHSLGATYRGTPVGTTGNFSTFSLQAIKHITSGDGGFIVSPYVNVTRDLKVLRWYGIDRDSPRTDFRCEDDVPEAGFKYHMNDISATIGLSNLLHAPYIVNINKENGKFYNTQLSTIKGITTIPIVEGGDPSYWLYTFHAERRDDLIKHLSAHGIVSSRVHERNDKHTCTKEYRAHLPGVDKAVSTMISIPVGFWVTSEDRQYIVDVIKKGW